MQRKTKTKLKNRRTPKKMIAFVLVATLILFGILLGVHYMQQPKAAYSGPIENVSTGLIGEYAALVLVAQSQGYFKDNGLNVTVKEYVSGPEALQDLLKGTVDTALGSDFAGVRDSFNGEDLKILATMSKSKAFFMLADESHGIHKISDLKGKRIGMTAKTVGEFYLGRFLTFNGLSLSDIKVVDMPQTELVKAQVEGRIDAAVLFEPNAYKAKAQIGAEAIQWSVQSEDSLYSLLYTTSRLTQQRPNVIKRYMKAVVAAEAFIKTHNVEARTIVAARLHYEPAYINYIWPRFVFETSLDQELLLGLEDKARWAMENKITSATTLPNYLRLIYFDGLEHAKPEGISVIR